MNILLVEPKFPRPGKQRNKHIPIGLLKLGAYHEKQNHVVYLARGLLDINEIPFNPQEINVTSEYTYWSKYVKEAVSHYRSLFPDAKIIVGGIYATLMPHHCKEYTQCDEVFVGRHEEAEKCIPLYELLGNGNKTQILHSSRGCIRKCSYCGAWKIEPEFKCKASIDGEVFKDTVLFYDDNLLGNPHISRILNELIFLKTHGQIKRCEAQCGFDGKILQKKPYLAKKLKKAGFVYPKIAWDRGYDEYPEIKEQIDLLLEAKFPKREISIFMLYNFEIPFEEMEKKRKKCWEWKIQITNCRYRPLDQTYDKFDGHRKYQKDTSYYIHKKTGWNDRKVRKFGRHIRRQNICIRYRLPFYSNEFERKRAGLDLVSEFKKLKTKTEKIQLLEDYCIEFWLPDA